MPRRGRAARRRRAIGHVFGRSLAKSCRSVRRLIKMTRALPEFAWKTRALDSTILNLRVAIERARSPETFLFEEVPVALGLLPLGETEDAAEVETFFSALNTALAQWSQCAPQALNNARDQLLLACELPASEAGWHKLRDEAARQCGSTVHPLLVPFFNRLVGESDAASLDGTLALIAHRPAKTWTDSDVNRFPDLVAPIGQALREVRRQHGGPDSGSKTRNYRGAGRVVGNRTASGQTVGEKAIENLCGQGRHARIAPRHSVSIGGVVE